MLKLVIVGSLGLRAWTAALILVPSFASAQTFGSIIDRVEPGMSPIALKSPEFKREKYSITFVDGPSNCNAIIRSVHQEEKIIHVRCDTSLKDPQSKYKNGELEIRSDFFHHYVAIFEKKYGPSDPRPFNAVIWHRSKGVYYSLELENYIGAPLTLRFEKHNNNIIPDKQEGGFTPQ